MLSGKNIKISVIIPTKNSHNRIEACLKSLVNQSFSDYEIIIVDGHSSDDTVDLASKFPVRIFFEDGGNRASACNVGVSHAKGEIVAFTDDDCVVPKDWLERIAINFDRDEMQVLGGPSLTPPESTHLEKALGATYAQVVDLTALGNKSGKKIAGCNSAYLKSTLINAGGFNEKLVTHEETEIHLRIFRKGGKIFYDPKMPVLHYRRTTFRSFYKQFYRYGLGKAGMLREHPETLAFSDVVAFLPFVYLPFLFVLFFLNQTLALNFFSATIILLMALFLFFSSFISIRSQEKTLFPFIFCALITYAFAESFGHLVGAVKNSERIETNNNSKI
jgi:glycosyltransferase involved in cell wall biosynthesis